MDSCEGTFFAAVPKMISKKSPDLLKGTRTNEVIPVRRLEREEAIEEKSR